MSRKKLPDVMMLESVIRFTADNIGNILSTKRIADIMTADGRKIDQKTVERYLTALCETFFVYETKDTTSRVSSCSRHWVNII